MPKIAILAGAHGLPHRVAQACHEQKKDVFVVALRDFADAKWVLDYPYTWLRLGQAGKLFRVLQEQNCTHLVMAGSLRRPRWWNLFPDWEGLKLFLKLKIHRRGDDTLLRALANVFEERGYHIIGADSLLRESLMPHGVLTKIQPNDAQRAAIIGALPYLKEWALADKGQAAIVRPDGMIKYETVLGTDMLIERHGMPRAFLIKIKKPQQDRRFDLPTLWLNTVQNAVDVGLAGIAVEGGNALFLEREKAVALADAHGLFIVGIDAT